MKALQWALAILLFLTAVGYVGSKMRPQTYESEFDLAAFAQLPATADGRVKPIDTIARVALLQASGYQSVDPRGEKIPAVKWYADLIAHRPASLDYPTFQITHPDILGLMDIKQTKRKIFSIREVFTHGPAVFEQARLAADLKNQDRKPFHRHVLKLANAMHQVDQLASARTPHLIPPIAADQPWMTLSEAAIRKDDSEATRLWATMLERYVADDANGFNQAVEQYCSLLDEHQSAEIARTRFETWFNHFALFEQGAGLYVFAFVLMCFSFLLSGISLKGWSRSLCWSAIYVLLLTFLLHSFGIGARMWLQGRPPVTNLYSSAVFIGWFCVPAALVVEYFFRKGLGVATAAIIGFLTLIVAHHLAMVEGDTMKNMQAVLDTNFWLATHVPTVTIGYAATFLAGFLAILFISLGLATPLLSRDVMKLFARAVYGVICFAMLLSFVGTILGGIWADQSWGRFWGWDPKENGAVLIVLINALILHARWAGLVRERGMMVLAVAGNIVTAWSWFGTNMLGFGLHAYGAMDSAKFWLYVFVASQLLMIALGCLPKSIWLSYTAQKTSVSI